MRMGQGKSCKSEIFNFMVCKSERPPAFSNGPGRAGASEICVVPRLPQALIRHRGNTVPLE